MLTTGSRMTVEAFLEEWEKLPDLKLAELIDGIVFIPGPRSTDLGFLSARMIWLLGEYASRTPGCKAGCHSCWRMEDSMPQPDAYLMVLPGYGGQASLDTQFAVGAPEFIVEICETATEVDFGPKADLYLRSGVREYITIEQFPQRVVWRTLFDGSFHEVPPGEDGIHRSKALPGLWFEPRTLWEEDGVAMGDAIRLGLASPEHEEFVAQLRQRHK